MESITIKYMDGTWETIDGVIDINMKDGIIAIETEDEKGIIIPLTAIKKIET